MLTTISSGTGESTYLDEQFVVEGWLLSDESGSSAALVTEEGRHRLFGSIGILLSTLFIALLGHLGRFWLLWGGYIQQRNELGQISRIKDDSASECDQKDDWSRNQVAGDVCPELSV